MPQKHKGKGKKKKRLIFKKKTKKRTNQSMIRKNSRAIKKLFKLQDPKYMLTMNNNVLVSTNLTWSGVQELTIIPSMAFQVPTPNNCYNYREEDSTKVSLRNIRIHFTVHVSPNEGGTIQPYYVALIKTTNGAGGPNGITLPRPNEIFDPLTNQYTTGLLAPWYGFRITQGPNSETLNNTKIIKQWYGHLSPNKGFSPCELNDTNNAPGTQNVIDNSGGGPLMNQTYTHDMFPSVRVVKYTHNCLNAKIEYPSNGATDAQNVKYFLVALAEGTDPTTGFRLNSCCKVNFRSD